VGKRRRKVRIKKAEVKKERKGPSRNWSQEHEEGLWDEPAGTEKKDAAEIHTKKEGREKKKCVPKPPGRGRKRGIS